MPASPTMSEGVMRFAFLIVGIIAWMVVRGWIMPKNEGQGRIFRILTLVTGTLVVLAFSWAMYWPTTSSIAAGARSLMATGVGPRPIVE
jgi:uncharacterized membrane protein YeaQ/YmgE (transglycosylase-associated protein family)